ncbi:hypothetical protein BH09BAC2_BH09BAC2_16920 [soil metagenome]
MKNFLIVSNVILLLLVGYLYVLHFKTDKKSTVQSSAVVDTTSGKSNRVAYIDRDSLQNNYEYYKVVKNELERKQVAGNSDFTGLQKRYQNRAVQLQQKGPTMNQQEQEAASREIAQMQQDLQNKRQQLDNELYSYNTKMREDILNRIQNFLKDYNKNGQYAYIFSYEPGLMFYKDTTLNITKDVVVGLNDLYVKNKKK